MQIPAKGAGRAAVIPQRPGISVKDGIALISHISAASSVQNLKEVHKTGTPWSDMADIYRDFGIGKPVLATQRKAGIPMTYPERLYLGREGRHREVPEYE